MKKQKIAAALACAVFFTAAWGAIAATMEEKIALFPPEWFVDDYFPGYYEPGDSVLYSSPADPHSDYDNRGSEPLNSGVGVPEPGSLVLLITGGLGLLACAQRRRR